MTREIKFRAWDKDAKAWVKGSTYTIHTTGKLWKVPRSVVLSQFTGLTDKNGKDIYEDDIVKGIWTYGAQPTQEEMADPEEWDVRRVQFKGGYYSPIGTTGDARYQLCEVIGNIYENPELLKRDGEAAA